MTGKKTSEYSNDTSTFDGSERLNGLNKTTENKNYLLSSLKSYFNSKSREEIVLDNREICDGNSISITDGELLEGSTLLGCGSYIDCENVDTIEITVPVLTTVATQGTAFYDGDKVFISSIARPQDTENGIETVALDVPSTAKYFRPTFWNYENGELYGKFQCTLNYESGFLGVGRKRPYQDGQIHFRVEVNQSVSNFWDTTNENLDVENIKGSTGVLVLPDDYVKEGNKTPIIMFCHGGSRKVTYTKWGYNGDEITSLTYLEQKERLRSAGYAVFDCQGQRDNDGETIYTTGTPQAVNAYRKSYDYIKEYYNVEENLYVIGSSMGGAIALNYCDCFSNVNALALMSPWTDILRCGWENWTSAYLEYRDLYVEYFGFDNTTTYEEEKMIGHDPALRIMTIDGVEVITSAKQATKAWIGALESGSDIYINAYRYMNALRNGGCSAQIREIDGVGHEITNGGSTIADEEIIAWFDKN